MITFIAVLENKIYSLTIRHRRIRKFFLLAENLGLSHTDEELHGGDMKLTKEQIEAVEGQRGAIKNRRWPKGVIVYQIEDSLCK